MSEPKSNDLPDPILPGSLGSSGKLTSSVISASELGPSVDKQQTVISSRPPLSDPPSGPGKIDLQELGKSLEGERLGQFILQQFVGGGGMGAVFRALDTTLNREVAVKVLSRSQSADEETVRRFRNEAQSAARLDHDNIARVYYVGEDRGVNYIVFEFIEGVNLRDFVEQRGPLSLAEAVSYTLQVAEALAHASQRDVIHRDIKPSNVLVSADGRAKLVDMGLARLHQVEHSNNDLTASGVTLGTFDYISPEQARDPRSADVRSDLYSLGCSFYYTLTGRPPFPDGTVLQKLLQHQGDEPPDARALRPDLPVEVTRILNRILAKNPARRYQTPVELISDLINLGNQLGIALTSSASAVWVTPRQRGLSRWEHHLPWMITILALVVIVIALDYHWSRTEDSVLPARVERPSHSGDRDARPFGEPAPEIPPDAPSSRDDQSPQSSDETGSSPEQNVIAAEDEPAVPSPQARADVRGDASQHLLKQLWNGDFGLKDIAGALFQAPRKVIDPKANANSSIEHSPDSAQSPAIAPAPESGGKLLVVGPAGSDDRETNETERRYASLRAAASAANSGDVIELRYNGRLEESPITLTNLKLTIRAHKDYQPIVKFCPTETDPVKYPRSMITVVGGELIMRDIPVELIIRRELAGTWALIQSRRADRVRLERCGLTIRNAGTAGTDGHWGVAFFEIDAAPGSEGTNMMEPGAIDEHQVAIELQNCVARGEATFLRSDELQPVKVVWENGLLATSERLLVAGGGPAQARQAGHIQIDLRHLTMIAHGGLAQLTNSEDNPSQLLAEIKCTNSILSAASGSALVEQKGTDPIDVLQKRLDWSGDHNVYDGFEVFWAIASSSGPQEKKLQFDAWQQFWQDREQSAKQEAFVFTSPPNSQRPVHTYAPADYDVARNSPARQGAPDGQNVGCRADHLPRLPDEEPAEPR